MIRSKTEKKIAGICGSLSMSLDIDVLIIRLLFVFLFFTSFPILSIYLLSWLLTKSE
jgi:phage shock protein PspC (stress-responsive transcriptional regulator)